MKSSTTTAFCTLGIQPQSPLQKSTSQFGKSFSLVLMFVLMCLGAQAQYTFNNGVASFGSPGNLNTLSAGSTRSTPVLVDLNNDGKLDIVTGNTSGTFRYFQNNGTAKYLPATPGIASWNSAVTNPFATLSTGTSFQGGASTPTFVDIDGDGDWDMFSGNGTGRFQFFQNNAGVFTEQIGAGNPLHQYEDSSTPGNFLRFDVGSNSTIGFLDGDADGDYDVVAGNSQGQFFYIENLGDKYFAGFLNQPETTPMPSAPQNLQGTGNATLSSTVCIVDMNCDKIPDVLSGSRVGAFQFRALDQLLSTFSVGVPTYPLDGKDINASVTAVNDYSYPAGGDLDGDGDVDFISGRSTGAFLYFQNTTCNAAPTFTPILVCGSDITVTLDENSDTEHTIVANDIDAGLSAASGCAPFDPASFSFTPDFVACANISTPVVVTLQARDNITGVKSSATACTVNVIVEDVTNPVAVCKDYIEVNVGSSNVSLGNLAVSAIDSASSDNCTTTLLRSLTYSYSTTLPLGCNDLGILPAQFIELRVEDASGNTNTCQTRINVVDKTAPVKTLATLPALARETCDYDGSMFPTSPIPVPTATDRCDGGPTPAARVKVNGGVEILANGDWDESGSPAIVAGTFTLTWIYEDASGNTSTQTQTLTITTPKLQFPNCPTATIVVEATAPPSTCVGQAIGLPDFDWTLLNASTVTLCGAAPPPTVTVSRTHMPTSIFPYGTTTVYYTAQDGAGNSGACSFKVIVRDDIGTGISVVHTNVITTALAFPFNTTSTNYGGFTIADDGGTNCGRNISWIGKPTVTNTQHSCAGPYVVTTQVAGIPVASGSFFPVGITLVDFVATDSKGNTYIVGGFYIEITDIFPTITCPQTSITVNAASGFCDALVTVPNAIASDNCPGTTIIVDYGDGNGFNPQSPTAQPRLFSSAYLTDYVNSPTTVYFEASDINSNISTCTVTVFIKDITKPVFSSCPPSKTIAVDITLGCGEYYDAIGSVWEDPFVYDACAPFDLTPSPANADSVSIVITHLDFDPVVLRDGDGGGTSGAQFDPNFNRTSEHLFAEGISTVTYTATDLAGNTGTCTFSVTVTDTEAPDVFCPLSPIVTSTEALCRDSVELGLYDDGTDAILIDPIAGLCGTPRINYRMPNTLTNLPATTTFAVGTHTLWAVVTDRSGNTNTCEFVIEVEDQNPPVMSNCPADITINDTNGGCGQNVTWTGPTFVDDCTAANALTISRSHNSGSFFAADGIPTQVVIISEDAAGNFSAGCTFMVTVFDKTAPVFTQCPSNTTINITNADLAICGADVEWTLAVTEDCSLGNIYFNDLTTQNYSQIYTITSNTPTTLAADFEETFPVGVTTLIYRGEDLAGNSSFCSFSVTVNDRQGPVIIDCPGNITVAVPNCSSTAVTWTAPTYGFDNCGTGSLSAASTPSGSSFPPGTSTVSYTATDNLGNTRVCSFTVLVRESTAPVFNSLVSNGNQPPCFGYGVEIPATDCLDNGVLSSLSQLTAPAATDNCAPTTATVTMLTPLVFPVNILGSLSIEWVATDASGNTATCEQTIYPVDKVAPVIVCPAALTLNTTPSGNCNVPVLTYTTTTGFALGVDNCDGFLSPSPFAGEIYNNAGVLFGFGGSLSVGVYNVQWTAEDNDGNTSTCNQSITIRDGVAPSISCPANKTVAATPPTCTVANTVGFLGTPIFSDNCGGPSVSNNAGASFGVGITTVRHTVTDAGGNTATCDQTVTVTCSGSCTPTTPAFSGTSNCGSTTPFALPNANCPTTVTVTAAQLSISATDNCGTTLTVANQSINVTASGNQTVTFTATVGANTVSCVRTVSVTCNTSSCVANQLPAVSCPSPNITVSADAGQCYASRSNVNFGTVNATDNCGTLTVTNDAPLQLLVANSPIMVTFTATNSFGPVSCAKMVTVTPNAEICGDGIDNDCDGDIDEGSANSGVFEALIASDGMSRDSGGFSVAIAGGIAVVGAPRNDGSGSNSGKAYVFEFDGTSWAQVAIIDPADNLAGDLFGYSVATDGQNIVIGSPKHASKGAAYFYEYTGVLTFKNKVMGTNNGDDYGASVSIDGNYAVVGAPYFDHSAVSASGAAYVLNLSGATWVPLQTLTSNAGFGKVNGRFGHSVSIENNSIAVGALNESAGAITFAGAVYTFYKSGATWTTPGLRLTQGAPVQYAYLGASVAIDGDLLVAGAYNDRIGVATGNRTGGAYLYKRTTANTNTFTQVSRLTSSDGALSDNFGWSVAIDGNEVLVGARFGGDFIGSDAGSAYHYTIPGSGISSAMTEDNQMVDVDFGASSDQFGFAVDIDAGTQIFGAPRHDEGGNIDRGVAYILANDCGNNRPAVSRNDRQDMEVAQAVRCFPNPSEDLVNIDITMDEANEVHIMVMDATGRLVSDIFHGTVEGVTRYYFDGSSVNSGMYYIRVESPAFFQIVPVAIVK